MKKTLNLFLLVLSTNLISQTYANTKNDPHIPISHCYHWLTPAYLDFKYTHANKNDGAVTFYTTPGSSNGAVAGPGLYCAKSPSGSYSYGTRIVRLDFVDDIVMYDATTGKKHCGHRGDYYPDQSECDKKPWDIKFYSGGGRGNYAWYVISNPQAISTWSGNSTQLVNDLNTSKSLNGSSFSIHADSTIKSMQNEVSKRGNETVWQNGSARMDIIDLLNDAKKLAMVPPLAVVSRVNSASKDKISDKVKKAVIIAQYERALRDSWLAFDDFQESFKKDAGLTTLYSEAMEQINYSKLSEYNSVVILLSLDAKLNAKPIADSNLKNLWKTALKSDSFLQNLVDYDFESKGKVISAFEASLGHPNQLVKDVKTKNQLALLQMMEKHLTGKGLAYPASQYSKVLIQDMAKLNYEILKLYDSLKNDKLEKEKAVVEILAQASQNSFNGFDPLISAHLVDRVENHLGQDTKDKYIAQLEAAIIPKSDKASYMILEDLDNKKLELSKTLNVNNYIIKIVNASIAERDPKNDTTNTFRVILTGIYHYFNNRINAEKDDTKKDALKDQATILFEDLADSFKGNDIPAYAYIALQNSSYFEGPLKYDEHPMQTAYANYRNGDASFDLLMEKVSKKSLDGTYLQFLLNKSKDKKGLNLFTLLTDYLVSSEFRTFLASDDFAISNKEKKSWNNIVFNKEYTGGGSRVAADICQITKVVKIHNDSFKKALSDTKMDSLQKVSDNIYSTYCK